MDIMHLLASGLHAPHPDADPGDWVQRGASPLQAKTTMENSKIEWTDHTFNPWIGCTRVSPACIGCYAETLMDSRYGRVRWGNGEERSRTSMANWAKPAAWNRAAAKSGQSPAVFCASLSDWLDDEVPIEWLADLLQVLAATPNLRWLMLTKRPENYASRIVAAFEHIAQLDSPHLLLCNMLPGDGVPGLPNVAFGCTIENQECADRRLPLLAKIPAAMRFVSMEPLLEPVDLGGYPIDWVIVGGKSGAHQNQTLNLDWARDIREQCSRHQRAFFMKQLGQYWVDGKGGYFGNNKHGDVEMFRLFPAEIAVRDRPDWLTQGGVEDEQSQAERESEQEERD